MRRSSTLLAAATLMAAAAGPQAVVTDARTTGLSEASVKNGHLQTNAAAPRDTKSARLGYGHELTPSKRVGKRYRASVRQHQRHAAKRRNRIKSKA